MSTKHENKDIEKEFDKIIQLLQERKNFALARYGDGEMHAVMRGQFSCSQWQINNIESIQKALIAGLCDLDHYLIGIPCGCLEKKDGFRSYIKQHHPINEQQLTFATIFCHAMYQRTQSQLVPVIKNYDIVLVSNEKTDLEQLETQGFNIIKHIPIPHNAWKQYQKTQEQLLHYIEQQHVKGKLFLFSAGPVSNILIHQLFKKNPSNTYLDVGSCMDKQLGLKYSDRCYLKWHNWKRLAKCYWEYKEDPNAISCDTHSKSKLDRLLLRLKSIYLHITEIKKTEA